MAKFTAKVNAGETVIKKNRMLTLTEGAELVTAEVGGEADFYSRKELKAGEDVVVEISGNSMFFVEAGDAIIEGGFVKIGVDGVAMSADTSELGYALSGAKKGEVVRILVAQSGGAGKQGPKGATGPAGKDGEDGATGPAGKDGEDGAKGETGPPGKDAV